MLAAAALTVPAAAVIARLPTEGGTLFVAETKHAMDRMMAGMDASPTGDVDRDFVTMMVPHHQGAIDMAVSELKYGKDENLKRIAQEIIVDQQQEIAAMRFALGQPLPESKPVPTGTTSHHSMHMEHSK